MIAYLRLLRAGLLLSPAADVTASLALCGLPWSMAAARAAIASVCIYAAGMVLNDHADRRHDARARPERPIPRGDVAAATALALGLTLLGAGIALSPQPWFHAGLAALVVGYDYALKHVVALGALTMGTLRGLNLFSASVVLAVPAPPALLYAALAYAVYIVAVTLLGVLEDEPRVKPKAIISLGLLAPIVACLAIGQTTQAQLGLALGGALLVTLWIKAIRRRDWDQRAIRRLMTFLLLGTMLYTGLLCLGSGRPIEAGAIWVAAWLGRRISRTIAIT